MPDKARERAPKLLPRPLVVGERAGLAAVLRKEGLPADDLDAPGRFFWRFDTLDDVPLGFGGIELHGPAALLRSVVTLPPGRHRGIGRAIVAALEAEAAIADCKAVYLATPSPEFFERLGYARCARAAVPQAIREASAFAACAPATTSAMVKRLAAG